MRSFPFDEGYFTSIDFKKEQLLKSILCSTFFSVCLLVCSSVQQCVSMTFLMQVSSCLHLEQLHLEQ